MMRVGWLVVVCLFALTSCDDRAATQDVNGDPGPPDAGPLLCDDTLTLAPEAPLDFGRVPAGGAAEQTITLTNEGVCAISLDAYEVVGSAGFELVNPDALADPDADGKPGLAPGASAQLTVRLRSDGRAAQAGLRLHSSAAHTPLLVVPLRANLGRCLRVEPREIDFGAVPVFERARDEIRLVSCGDRAVTVDEATLDGAGAFYVAAETPIHLTPGAETSLPVEFFPRAAGDFAGELRLVTDDPAQPELSIPLVGQGRANRCPTPQVAREHLDTVPLGTVTLDGSPSTDPEAGVVEWRWTLVEAPAGSTTRLVERLFDPLRPQAGGSADDPETPQVLLWADLAGVYVVELQVVDAFGLVSPGDDCPSAAARVEVVAEPQDDLHIQLVWHTPADDDETDDFGTDVDLYLQHPAGVSWRDPQRLCFYGNSNPDWGRPGPDADPSLDIDDVSGAGPENINLDRPEDTSDFAREYRIGVSYYGAGDFGESTATVRVYLSGQLEAEFERSLPFTGSFWEVTGVEWTPQRHGTNIIDRLFPDTP